VNLSVLRAIFNPGLPQELESLMTLIFKLREQRTGLEKSILCILRRRFGEVTPEVQAKLVGLTLPELDALLDEALVAPSLSHFLAS
jgi:hypothetical protein